MKKKIWAAFTVLSVVSISSVVAETATPVGTWKTMDDKTGHAKSIVQITEDKGELSAKVVKVLESDRGPHPLCVACTGDRKDKPVEGMTIMWGVKKNGETWSGGEILDPVNGQTYRVKLTPLENGRKLDVHGYIGVALLGRSQVWQRE